MLQPTSETVILVDEHDIQIGTMEKHEAHRKKLRHRAFSVFITRPNGDILLQQRAAGKYHSPLLWTNTCCGHPRPNEPTGAAAERRLNEEMGFTCPLSEITVFEYIADFGELAEHEVDHVFVGEYTESFQVNPDEVQAWRWESVETITTELHEHPEHFTAWFGIIWQHVAGYLASAQMQ